MFERDIEEYEGIRREYQQKIADRMGKKQWMEYNEILFSAHSCAIEGNSFTVDDSCHLVIAPIHTLLLQARHCLINKQFVEAM